MDPLRLPAENGWHWIKKGYALFMKAPLLWIALLIAFFIIVMFISAVPVVGGPLASLLSPVFLAGMMSGCRALEEGKELELAHLFSGFRQNTSQLITLGGISVVGQFLILGIMMLAGGATLVGILMSEAEPDINALMSAMAGATFAISVGVALYLFLSSVIQFSTILVYFRNLSPVQAMQLTFSAFLINIMPFIVYGLTLALLVFLGLIPMGLGLLIVFPLSYTSMYCCYADIFPTLNSDSGNAAKEDDQFTQDRSIF